MVKYKKCRTPALKALLASLIQSFLMFSKSIGRNQCHEIGVLVLINQHLGNNHWIISCDNQLKRADSRTKLAFTCSQSTIETLEEGVKYLQS